MPLSLGGLGDLVGDTLVATSEELPQSLRDTLAARGRPRRSRLGASRRARASARVHGLPARAGARRSRTGRRRRCAVARSAASQRIVAFAIRRLADAHGRHSRRRSAATKPIRSTSCMGSMTGSRRSGSGPLSIGALHHLLRIRLGVRIGRPTLARVHEASGGNPMFALEFARAVAGRGAAPGPLPVPTSLEELVRERVAAYPPRIRMLLAADGCSRAPDASAARGCHRGRRPLARRGVADGIRDAGRGRPRSIRSPAARLGGIRRPPAGAPPPAP